MEIKYSFCCLTPNKACAPKWLLMACASDAMGQGLGTRILQRRVAFWATNIKCVLASQCKSEARIEKPYSSISANIPTLGRRHLQMSMSDATSTPRSNKRSCTLPFCVMMHACLAWYRRRKTRPEKESKRPCSDSTLVPNSEVDDFSMKMGSIPMDSPVIMKNQPKPPQPAVPASHIAGPQRFCKHSSEFDRRKWGELQPQVVPSDMVLQRVKLSSMDSSPLRASLEVAAHG